MPERPSVVIDTNVFVAAGFRPRSASARVLAAVRAGALRLVWDDATRGETERVVRRIPRLDWPAVADLFAAESRWPGPTRPTDFLDVPDPDDRKFAALAATAGATLVTMDEHLLAARGRGDVRIAMPSEVVVQAAR
jgi:predicted nucleic acid-binding protein